MKSARLSGPLLALAALSMFSCSAEPRGQVILALQTDMSLPKDIDRIRIVVSYADTNGIVFQENYDRIVEPDNPRPLRLPATLSLVAPEVGNRPIRIKVLAFRGLVVRGNFEDPVIRVVRDAVTTVPKDRIVTLPVPIEFLCDGAAKAKTDAAGKPVRDDDGQIIIESTCGDGLTCKAGKCVADEVPSEELSDYDETEVFGGGTGDGDGTCFNTGSCFDGATTLSLDMGAYDVDNTNCRAAAPVGAFNVGIETQGSGVCNDKGCYVALDAESDSGWKFGADGQSIVLPPAICEKFKKAEIAGVVGTPTGAAPCAQKRASVPTCGPWSASGDAVYTPLDPKAPTVVVGGQENPNAIAVDAANIYWTNQGNLVDTKTPGNVKRAPISGSGPSVVAYTKGVPQGLALDKRGFVLWTDATGTADGTVGFAPLGEPSAPAETALFGGLLQPAGISVSDQDVYITELGGDRVSRVSTTIENDVLTKGAVTLIPNVIPPGVAPWSVVAAPEAVCFGYQGTPGNADGVVACLVGGVESVVLATNLKTPRSLVFETSPTDNKLVALYFAELDAQGTIQRATFTGAGFSQPQLVVSSVARPSGLALDTTAAGPVVYYTSLGDSSIKGLRVWDATTFTVAENRNNPNAVAVDANFVYWVEGGTPNTNEGAIVKALKPAL